MNIVAIDPSYGPKSGGTLVKIKVNAPLGYVNLSCSFGAVNPTGGPGDGESVPVPVTQLYFMTYYWKVRIYWMSVVSVHPYVGHPFIGRSLFGPSVVLMGETKSQT